MKYAGLFFTISMTMSVTAQTWFQVPSQTDKKLNAIDFPSSSVGYIGGNDSVLLKTENGGRTWTRINPSGISFTTAGINITGLDFVNEDQGYMVVSSFSWSGSVWKTTDGGQSWSDIPDLMICFPKTTYFLDVDNGFAAGSDCFWGEAIHPFKAGTWQPVQHVNGSGEAITAIDFFNDSLGLAAGDGSYILRTVDGGATWDTVRSSVDSFAITDVLIVNDTLAYATYAETGSVGLLVTTDAGLSWQEDWSSGTFLYPGYNAAAMTASGRLYFGGQPLSGSGIMMAHEDVGWKYSNVSQAINDVATYPDTVVFAVGDSGYIITNTDPAFLSVPVMMTDFSVRAYPIPAVEEINVTITGTEAISLDMTDLQGRMVFSERNINKPVHTIKLGNLHPGMYLLRVITAAGIRSEKIYIANSH